MFLVQRNAVNEKKFGNLVNLLNPYSLNTNWRRMDLGTNVDLERLKKRDAEALNQWVHRHYDDIYRLLRHLTRQREAAEDLAQQTFLKAIQALPGYRGEASQKTWLSQIAFREYIAWRRKRRLFLPLEVLSPKADQNFKSVEDGEVLLSALHMLPSALREAFLLYEVQQLSIEEIATVTGSPVGTVKSRLHHARTRMQSLLESTYPTEIRYECR
jgi:RNA polymerase sigma-70 factor (ECF subfamily)